MGPEAAPALAPRRRGRRRRRRRQRLAAAALGVAVAIGLFLWTVHYDGVGPAPSNAGTLSVRLAPSPSVGYSPLTVTLAATVAGGTPPYAVTWTSGAMVIGSGSVSVVAFDIAGNQTVTARAVDSAGATASASTVITIVSPYPEAKAFIPAQSSVNSDLLAIDWHASGPVSSCTLASWGTIGVPSFAACGAAGGDVHTQATTESVVFQVDPDDPEITPVLFQSADPGVQIAIGWWYNDTSPMANEQAGVIPVITAIESL